MAEKEESKAIVVKIKGPIKVDKLEEAIEVELKKKLLRFKTDLLNDGDFVIVQIDDQMGSGIDKLKKDKR